MQHRKFKNVTSKETMTKRQPYVCLTRPQHKALEASVHELMQKQTGSGYPVSTRFFTDVPWAAGVRFYVRKSPEGPGFYDDMEQMIGRGIDWSRVGDVSDEELDYQEGLKEGYHGFDKHAAATDCTEKCL